MMIFSKFRPRRLCHGLTAKEFRCKCHNEGCKATIIHPKLLKAYESLRTFLDVPFTINSGYRCPAHNAHIGGKPMSRHQTGEAIDISAKNILDVWAIERVKFIAKESGFTYIEYHNKGNFFHLDVREVSNGT